MYSNPSADGPTADKGRPVMRHSTIGLQKRWREGEKLVMVTAYDYTSAKLVDRAELPLILVGDSLGMVVQGNDSTLPVTIDDIIYHSRLVVRGSKRALVVGDLPFLTYTNPEQAVHNAGRLMQESGCQSVKLEGGQDMVDTVRRLVSLGIPVMGHLGYTPQSVNQIGLRVQARSAEAARKLIEDALALQKAGAWAIVLELIPAELAAAVSDRLDIPTIGIGAGAGCGGQVQVWPDIFGMDLDFTPKHAKHFRELGQEMISALVEYRDEVQQGTFPTSANGSTMKAEDLNAAIVSMWGDD